MSKRCPLVIYISTGVVCGAAVIITMLLIWRCMVKKRKDKPETQMDYSRPDEDRNEVSDVEMTERLYDNITVHHSAPYDDRLKDDVESDEPVYENVTDCVEVLRRAREQGPLRYKGEPIAIFPDYTASVARALAAFNDVRNLLRGKRDVRYGIMFPARFQISYKGDSKDFLDPEKAMAYVKSMIQNEEM
ncbi:putative transposase element L1Md-A101/L1Md-A102/L1Md-A2 [Labeo rohita]|uniref:Putative transposase element L1Md-A101/L1Md-A102/L1Md-A2 n=1 Tax=Labeo rohita TaxID=84645 RepID=A0A498NM97_LABRO|nr:putative transposase element L1Md-A101/L1Md-A102/L1Md-A2 [Labeo rohita]